MAERDDSAARTEAPTKSRLREARRDGQVARSGALSGLLVLLSAVVLLASAATRLVTSGTALVRHMLSVRVAPGRTAELTDELWAAAAPMLGAAGLVCGGLLVMALVAGLLQVGPVLAWKRLAPTMERVSPAAGWRRMFSTRGAVRAALAVVQISLVALVVWLWGRGHVVDLLALAALPPSAMVGRLSELGVALSLCLLAVLAPMAGVDYAYQRWQLRRDLRMTHRELREELRRGAADPQIRQRRRQARRRTREAAPPVAAIGQGAA